MNINEQYVRSILERLRKREQGIQKLLQSNESIHGTDIDKVQLKLNLISVSQQIKQLTSNYRLLKSVENMLLNDPNNKDLLSQIDYLRHQILNLEPRRRQNDTTTKKSSFDEKIFSPKTNTAPYNYDILPSTLQGEHSTTMKG